MHSSLGAPDLSISGFILSRTHCILQVFGDKNGIFTRLLYSGSLSYLY